MYKFTFVCLFFRGPDGVFFLVLGLAFVYNVSVFSTTWRNIPTERQRNLLFTPRLLAHFRARPRLHTPWIRLASMPCQLEYKRHGIRTPFRARCSSVSKITYRVGGFWHEHHDFFLASQHPNGANRLLPQYPQHLHWVLRTIASDSSYPARNSSHRHTQKSHLSPSSSLPLSATRKGISINFISNLIHYCTFSFHSPHSTRLFQSSKPFSFSVFYLFSQFSILILITTSSVNS